MNKKQLQESIMAGVKKAFANNKALNEGFSQWKDTNLPKFDFDKFKELFKEFMSILFNLINEGQISSLRFMKYDKNSSSWGTLVGITDETTVESFLGNTAKALQDLQNETKTKDKFAVAMGSTAIAITVNGDTYLYQFIESTLDPASGKVVINSRVIDSISVQSYKNNTKGYKVYITSKHLLNDFEEIKDYFS